MISTYGTIKTDFPQNLPVFGKYDVVVVGGGIAGCSAAVAAARKGVSVCLVEREFMAGGLATCGLVWCYLPLCDGMGHKISSGICEEFFKLSVADGSGKIPECWDDNGDISERVKIRYESEFNPLSFATKIEDVLINNGVKIRYGSQLCSVIRNGRRINALVVSEKQGLGAILCGTVIDATGDADVCFISGESVEIRDNNRLAFWTYTDKEGQIRRQETQIPLYGKIPDGERTYCGIITGDITDFCIESRHRAKLICESKSLGIPVMMASIPQFRLSRRLIGKYTLTLNDEGVWFDDCVGMIADWRFRSSVYCVPYSIMLPQNTDNMLVAGRCVSAQPDAGDTVRSIPACAVFGQAAGTAAALAEKNALNVSKFPVDLIQKSLKDDGVLIEEKLLCKHNSKSHDE